MELKSGVLLQGGKYRIISHLGRGGFGMTYLAEQVMAKRKVCIKEFFPKDFYKRESDTGEITLSSDGFAASMNRFKTKFIKEAQTIAALDHPNIIAVHDVFEENNTAYYIMDYVDGESLSAMVKRRGKLKEDEAVEYIIEVATALSHIHSQQIMHLDVKPGNIMVRKKDGRAILIDFGLSKHYDVASGEATSTTPVGVSHGFAPLEQYKQGGVSTFSPETDIYSLGATLYFLVVGSVPPQAADIADDGLPALPKSLSSNVRVAIERSMSEKRRDRPHSISEFLYILNSDTPVVNSREDERTVITSQKSAPAPKSAYKATNIPTSSYATKSTNKPAVTPAQKHKPANNKAVEWQPSSTSLAILEEKAKAARRRKTIKIILIIIGVIVGGIVLFYVVKAILMILAIVAVIGILGMGSSKD